MSVLQTGNLVFVKGDGPRQTPTRVIGHDLASFSFTLEDGSTRFGGALRELTGLERTEARPYIGSVVTCLDEQRPELFLKQGKVTRVWERLGGKISYIVIEGLPDEELWEDWALSKPKDYRRFIQEEREIMAIDTKTASSELEKRMRLQEEHPVMKTVIRKREVDDDQPLDHSNADTPELVPERVLAVFSEHESRLLALESDPQPEPVSVEYDRFTGQAFVKVAGADSDGRALYREKRDGQAPTYTRRYPAEMVPTLGKVETLATLTDAAFRRGLAFQSARVSHVAKQTLVALLTLACVWGVVAGLQALAAWAS